MRPHRELFDHDADVGVRGVGPDRASAFEQVALALTDVVVPAESVHPDVAVDITCRAPDDRFLLYDWLNALVYEMAVRRMVFGRYEVQLDGTALHGTAWGEPVGRHAAAVEVKGATMTGVRVARREDGAWVAECVVDV